MTLDVAKIRKDFPILKRQVHGVPLVYLDNAATSQKPRQVIDAMTDYYEHHHGGVHRSVHALGEEVRGGGADDAAAHDDGAQGSSSNVYLPSCWPIRPNRGRSCVKPTIHFSSTARGRMTFFAASVSSG